MRYWCEEMESMGSWIAAPNKAEAADIYVNGFHSGPRLSPPLLVNHDWGDFYAVYEDGELIDHIWVRTEEEVEEHDRRVAKQAEAPTKLVYSG